MTDQTAAQGDRSVAVGRDVVNSTIITGDVHLHGYLPTGAPFQAPVVPRYFVPRPELSDELKHLLLADEARAPGALVVSAVHGLGGIGKTTLAAALAHDPDLQARFPDGILWVTLGQKPETLSRLHEWIQSLGDYDYHPTTIDGASAHLRTLLHDKACLLVVDDAWGADHARAFLAGGERCQALVATRDATLARKVGARLFDLDVMTEPQALALFEARLGPLAAEQEGAAALAGELGYLPLALELAAAQVEGGFTWAELLDDFRQGLAGLAVLDLDEATYRNESLRISFRLSLEQLSPQDRGAFAWLGVLPEDARLNPAMAATLWDQPEAEARKRLRRLRDRALLKAVGDNRYVLHDLLHDEAGLRLAEHMPLPEAHADLLDRYRRKISDEAWHRLPDDGYVHEHLAWHMEQAGQAEAIHALLRLETEAGRNAWYEAREALGQTAGYLDDVRRAWQLAEEACANQPSPISAGLQCRYALMTASLNSLIWGIPPTLLNAMVSQGTWSLARALATIRRHPDEGKRSKLLVGLAPQLPEPFLKETLSIAREIGDKRIRVTTLLGLSAHWAGPKREQVLQEALAIAGSIEDSGERAESLTALVPYLPAQDRDEVAQEALVAIQAVERIRYSQLETLIKLIPVLPEYLLKKALAVARAITSESYRVQALGCVAFHMLDSERQPIVQEALETIRSIKWEGDYAQALAGLAPYLSAPDLKTTLEMVRSIESTRWRAYALHKLAGQYGGAEQEQIIQEALAAAWKISEPREFTMVMSELFPHLPEPERDHVLQEALRATGTILLEPERGLALTQLAPLLSEATWQEAIKIAQRITTKRWQVLALEAIAARLAELGQFEKALSAAQVIGDVTGQAQALAQLAPHLPEADRESGIQAAMQAARSNLEKGEQAQVLAQLAVHMPEAERQNVLREALAAVQTWGVINPESYLSNTIPYLPWPYLEEALAIAQGYQSEVSRDWVLAALAPRAAELGYAGESLAIAREIKDDLRQSQALAQLAPHLPERLLPDGLAIARTIEDRDYRVMALAGLVPHLPQPVKDEILQEALPLAHTVRTEWWQATALARLVPHLSQPLQGETVGTIITLVKEIKAGTEWAEVISAVIAYLADAERQAVLQEAFTKAQAIKEDMWRAKTLARLIPSLPNCEREKFVEQALQAAQAVERGDDRAGALCDLVPHWAALSPTARYHLWRQTTLASARHTRGRLLSDLRLLVPVLDKVGGEEGIAETFCAIQDVGRWWP